MNLFKKEKLVDCPMKNECTKDKCGIWISTDNGGMCSIALVATSIKGIFTLLKKSKSAIELYFRKQEQESELMDMDNKKGDDQNVFHG